MKKNGKFLLFFLFLTIFFNGCNNFFHDLLPPSNNEIISFAVQFPDGSRSATSNEIKNQTVTVTVPDGTDLTNLIPVVTVSEKATVIPGTLPYLNKVFPDRDLMHLAVEMYDAFNNGTFQDWFLKFVMESPKVSIPPLDMPVDFSVPVYFCVISGDGKYQLYTVTVLTETEKKIEDTGIIPPGADNFILSFEVPEQKGVSEIIHEPIGKASYGTVDFIISQDANIRSLLPTITVSEGARIIPLTMAYIMDCGFSYEQMLGFYTGYSTATDLEKYVTTFLRRATNIVYPEITMPIDFSEAVPFAVVGSDGGVRVYNANCSVYDGTPKLENVYFSKANNPYLIKDFECEISSNNFTGKATYPDEMELDYNLIPDIVFIGEKATYSINGGAETEIISGVTVIPFTSEDRTCTITVYREGNTKTYNLTVDKFIDPDTIRSITDYRFKKINNNIKNTVIASIYNEGDTGFISAKILYEGSIAPYDLVADFISPGIVTTADTMQGAVPGTVQSSGVTSNNFQYSRKFLCTSKNGLYSRLYTVNIEFIQVIPAEVAIKTFTFPVYLNSDLSQDSVAIINDADGSIRCQVTYASETVPKTLIPEFSATGAVSCSGITQTSGYTANNFTYSQYYKVTVEDEFYGTLTKNYRVEVVFKQDNASACELLTFGFATEDNPSLTNDVTATITQRNGSIYGFMPFGAGATEGNTLVPFFTAEGTVSVNGETQTSGASSQDFSSPVTYTVTSANGRYTKDYTVTLQESGSIIYVDSEAYGLNNGTSWQDAFISLDKALEQAASAPKEVMQELWVAARDKDYIPLELNGFKIRSNLIIRGGFNGTETNADERETDIDGNLKKRTGLDNSARSMASLFNTQNSSGIFEVEGCSVSCNYFVKDMTSDSNDSSYVDSNCFDKLSLTDCKIINKDYFLLRDFDRKDFLCRTLIIENCILDDLLCCGAINPTTHLIEFPPVSEILITNSKGSTSSTKPNVSLCLYGESLQLENNNFTELFVQKGNAQIKNCEIEFLLSWTTTVIDDCNIKFLYHDYIYNEYSEVYYPFEFFDEDDLTMQDTDVDNANINCRKANLTVQNCSINDGMLEVKFVSNECMIQNSKIVCSIYIYDGYDVSSDGAVYILENTFTSPSITCRINSYYFDFRNNTFENSNFNYQGSLIDFSKNVVPSGELLGSIQFNCCNEFNLTCSFNDLTVDNFYGQLGSSVTYNFNNCNLRKVDITFSPDNVFMKDCKFPFEDTYVVLNSGSINNCISSDVVNAKFYLFNVDISNSNLVASRFIYEKSDSIISKLDLKGAKTSTYSSYRSCSGYIDCHTLKDSSIANLKGLEDETIDTINSVYIENCNFISLETSKASVIDCYEIKKSNLRNCTILSNLWLVDCDIIEDVSFDNCGGYSTLLYVKGDSLINCSFKNCELLKYVRNSPMSELIVGSFSTVKNCIFEDNRITGKGSKTSLVRGGIFSLYFSMTKNYYFENCTFANNQFEVYLEDSYESYKYDSFNKYHELNVHMLSCICLSCTSSDCILTLKNCEFSNTTTRGVTFVDTTNDDKHWNCENSGAAFINMIANFSGCKIILEGTNKYKTYDKYDKPFYLYGITVQGSWQ
ncbi:MAG: hypothetical protein IJ312_05850 [Treponema sp.]|nr:hypothetical protein [Treponema sp.]